MGFTDGLSAAYRSGRTRRAVGGTTGVMFLDSTRLTDTAPS